MGRDARAYLWDVSAAAALIEEFCTGRDLDAFERDALFRSAVERQLMIVGEALARLAKADPMLAARIPDLPKIVAFRNVIVHGYAGLLPERTWSSVRDDLPQLRVLVERLLEEAEPPESSP